MIPPDEETKSTDKATFERAKRDIANCYSNKQLLDTFTVDHLLWKLSPMTLKSILAILQLLSLIHI